MQTGWSVSRLRGVSAAITSLAIVFSWALLGSFVPRAFAQAGISDDSANRRAAAGLRYAWRPGETYIYAVRIEVEEPDYYETYSGNVTYQARDAGADAVTLVCSGSLPPQRKYKAGRAPAPAGIPRIGPLFPGRLHDPFSHFGRPFGRPFGAPGGFPNQPIAFATANEVQIDALGHVLSSRGGSDLPCALGNLTQLVVDPLPQRNQNTWQVNRDIQLVLEEIRRLSPFSHFGHEEKTNYPGHEQTVYTLQAPQGKTVRIVKRYELWTDRQADGQPILQLTGDGQLTFDLNLGVPRACEFHGNLYDRTEPNTVVRTPMSLTYRLLEGAEREAVLHPPPPPVQPNPPANVVANPGAPPTTSPATNPGAPPAPAPLPPLAQSDINRLLTAVSSEQRFQRNLAATPPSPDARTLTEEEISQALLDMASSDGGRHNGGASKLAEARPNFYRSGVVQAIVRGLLPLLDDKDGFARSSAVKALGVWGGHAAVPIIARQVDDESFGVRWATFDAVARIGDPRAAAPVARWLRKDTGFAGKTLRALGPGAAPAVLPYLSDPEWTVRLEVCKTLREIGTRDCIPALQHTQGEGGLVAGAANEAIQAIQARR